MTSQSTRCFSREPRTPSPTLGTSTMPTRSRNLSWKPQVGVAVCLWVCACMYVCVCACVCEMRERESSTCIHMVFLILVTCMCVPKKFAFCGNLHNDQPGLMANPHSYVHFVLVLNFSFCFMLVKNPLMRAFVLRSTWLEDTCFPVPNCIL